MKRLFRMWVAIGLAALAAGSFARAETVVLGGSGSTLEMMQILGSAYAKANPGFQLRVLPSLGSGGAMKGMAAGTIDIGSISRELRPDEMAKGFQASLLAHTPVVIATNRMAERSISTQQLEKIYGGQQTRWGDQTAIRLVLRPAAETDTVLISGLSAGMRTAVQEALSKEGMLVATTDQEAATALEKQPGSLGTSTLGLIRSEKRPLKILDLNGIPAETAGRANDRYPLNKPLVLVHRNDARAQVLAFARFVQSADAEALLQSNGYVPASRGR